MIRDFTYTSLPQRIVFGAGALQHLGREIDALDARRALVLCTPGQRDKAERVAAMLGAQAAGIFDGAVMHVPIETARDAR
jgi:alcohol dehydrogenase class IV